MENQLSMRDGFVRVEVDCGRSGVSISQRPHSSNGYTAICKVRDAQSEFGHYDFDVTWR
jgi:hypothetical protein